MPLGPTCCTCAARLVDENEYKDVKSEKPRLNRRLSCCGRIVCARCIELNPRFATYCPFCQTTRLVREAASSAQSAPNPPPYTPPEPESSTDPSAVSPDPHHHHDSIDPSRTPPPSYSAVAPVPPQGSTQNPEYLESPAVSASEDVVHFLSPLHTLHSLSLAYGVPLPILRAHNRLHSDHLLSARHKVSIPRTHYTGNSLSPRPVEGEEESERKANLKRFMLRCKCADYKYATLYLEEHDWNLDKAVAKWADDEIWEREHPVGKGKRRLKLQR